MLLLPPYVDFLVDTKSSCVILDHMGGFDRDLRCDVIDQLVVRCPAMQQVGTEYIVNQALKDRYPTLSIDFDVGAWIKGNAIDTFAQHTVHPTVNFKYFLCSFNGSPHVSRKLLVAILYKFGYFNNDTCSKNFQFSTDIIDGHIMDLSSAQHRLYRKFFIGESSEVFFGQTISFGYNRYQHHLNVQQLAGPITQSFLHLVSETLATSYYPFVTEKFLYSVVNRGLFLAYAQPQWHKHLQQYFGFMPYSKIFDYQFDRIQDPVKRLIALITMISKFSILSRDDWRDLYEMEAHTIEYNYDHYFSGRYLQSLRNVT